MSLTILKSIFKTIKANKIDLSSKGKFNVADTLVGAIVNQPK